MRILIRRVDNLGDVVIAQPVFREILRDFPHAEVTAMVRPEHRGLIAPWVHNFMAPRPPEALPSLCRRFDLTVDIEYTLPRRYRPRPLGRARLIHVGAVDWSKPQHVYKHLLDGLRAHGLPVRNGRPRLRPPAGDRRAAGDLLDRLRLDSTAQLLVAVNPGAGFRGKIWPVDHLIRVCRWLTAEFGAKILVLSRSANDREARLLAARLPRSHAYSIASHPVEIIAALLARVDLYLGNDSGLGHVAAAVGTPTVTIFGPTSPLLWRPAANNAVIVRCLEPMYRSCGYAHAGKCRQRACLKGLTPEDVADAVLLTLGRHLDRAGKPGLDGIAVARDLRMEKTTAGAVLLSRQNPRPLLVRSGLTKVQGILQAVRATGSYAATLARCRDHKRLLDYLVMHRLVVSSSNLKKYRRL